MNAFQTALAATSLAAVATTAGILLIRRYEVWGRQNTVYFATFAAGVLISAALLHLVPESLDMNPAAPIFMLAGYFAMHLYNRFIRGYTCEHAACDPDDPHAPHSHDYAFGLVPLLGIGLHSLIDGFIYSVTYTVSTFTGILTTLGMILHEFPEGIVTYLLLRESGFTEKRSFWLAFAAAALTTPAGMLLSFPFVGHTGNDVLGLLLALSAGVLIYVGATHLLPHAEREHRRYSEFALAGGILTAIGIIALRH